VIADQWYLRVLFADSEALLFDLGEDEPAARQLFRDTRRQFEKAKNDRAVSSHVDIGAVRYEVSEVLHVELIEPGSDVQGRVVEWTWVRP
jgi:hypothetical protein